MTLDDGESQGETQSKLSQEPEAPALGFGAKLWNLFVDPRKTFASVGKNHEWIILWILVSLISVGTILPNREVIFRDQLQQVETRLDQNQQLTPEQRRQALDAAESQMKFFAIVGTPIFILAALFIVASILLFIGNIILAGTIGFQKMLNAYAWTMMIAIPAGIITMILIKAKGSMDVSLGLGVLTTPDTGAFVKSLLSSIEVFAIWQVWLSALAISVLAPADTKKAFWSVATAWLVWIIVKAGLATLGSTFAA